MKRLNNSRFGWYWLDTSEWCDGLMDDQGDFIPEYRLFKETPVSLLLYLAMTFPKSNCISCWNE